MHTGHHVCLRFRGCTHMQGWRPVPAKTPGSPRAAHTSASSRGPPTCLAPPAPLPRFHGALSRKPGVLSPLGASVSLSTQWLAGEGVDPGDHQGLLCTERETGPEVEGTSPRAQSLPQARALGPHGPHQPWAGGPASLCPRPVLRDNGCQPPAHFPSARQPGGRLKRCGNIRGTSRLL